MKEGRDADVRRARHASVASSPATAPCRSSARADAAGLTPPRLSPTITSMHGPIILARTLTIPSLKGKGTLWQYHPRSDHHSKVACWGILFDLLQNSNLLREHVASGRLIFGINHEMRDFRTGRKKDLDLVLARPGTVALKKPLTFRSLLTKWGILLNAEERRRLAQLPDPVQHSVGAVHLALEAKACMTEHGKARPRLYD